MSTLIIYLTYLVTYLIKFCPTRRIKMNHRPTLPLSIPRFHQCPSRLSPVGSSHAASTGVMVSARTSDEASMTTTDLAMEPRKSPAGPVKIAIGMNARMVVAVEDSSGIRMRFTEPVIASSGK